MKRKTTEQFIKEAISIHGNKYDYSKTIYVNTLTPIKIICPIHGEAEQMPCNHLHGKGCKKCAIDRHRKLLLSKDFVERAQKVHLSRYDYSEVEYSGFKKKISIICKIHGTFSTTPRAHLNGSGCPQCQERKYTKQICHAEALKYTTRGDFRKSSNAMYGVASKHGWLNDICLHMKGRVKRKAGWWDDINHCIETALLYETPQELMKAEKGCHSKIMNYHWQDVCFAHMKYRTKEYTNEQLAKKALECKTHKEFRERHSGAYMSAKKRGIYDKICKHMPILQKGEKSKIPLTHENCRLIASQFETRSVFQKHENGRWYNYATRNNILREVCSHMRIVGNKKKRCIYVAEFSDHSIYVGLTCDTKRRWQDHVSAEDSAVYLHIQETGLKPIFTIIHNYVNIETAQKLEGEYEQYYRDEGWNVLNRARTGALGGEAGYTKEEVIEVASHYSTLKEFREKDAGYYEAGYRSDYWNEIRNICTPHQHLKYTETELQDIAQKYTNKTDFYHSVHGAYEAAKKMGILDAICKHMTNNEYRHKWIDEEIFDASLLCKTRKEFKIRFPKEYQVASFTKRMKYFCSHMNPIEKWTIDAITLEAQKYSRRSDFSKGCGSAYNAAKRHGILDMVCIHMPKPNPKVESCQCDSLNDAKNLAAKCHNRTEFKRRYNKAYEKLRTLKMLDEACSHMGKPKWPTKKWTPEARKIAASQCKTRKEFCVKFSWAHYLASQNKGELDRICSHMPKPNRWSKELLIEIASHCSNMQELREYNYEAYTHTHKKGKTTFMKMYFKKNEE